MAIRQEFWAAQIRSWIPGCVYQGESSEEAVIQAMALLLDRMEQLADEHVKETFICTAEGGFLDEHGSERNIARSPGEIDLQYSERVKNIINSTSCPEIKRIVDALLDVGEATIVEDFDAGLFFNREEAFYNRGDLLIIAIYNTFSIIVDKQVHEPYSFFDREYFMDREDFIGRLESSLELFQLIVEAVNRAKALGTLYRLVERLE